MPDARPIVSLDRVDAVLGGAPVLSGASLEIREGEGWAVLGANGSGKSTLLRLLRGDLWPHPSSAGRRLFFGEEGAQESPIGVRDRISLVAPEGQDAYVRRDWDLPAEAVVRSGFHDQLWPQSPATPAQAARIREVAALLGIEPLLGRSILSLSRGEARRVLLARALAPAPRLLLLDEACDGLDAAARGAFLGLVSRVARGGTAVVMATHRTEEIVPEVDRVAVLEGGRVARIVSREEAVGGGRDLRRDRIRGSGPRRSSVRPEPLGAGPHPAHPEPSGREATAESRDARDGRRAAAGGAESRGRVLFDLSGVTVLVEGRAVLDRVSWTMRARESWAIVGPNGAGKSTFLRLLAGEEQPAAGTIRRLDLGTRASALDLHRRVASVGPELQARHRADATAGEVVLSGFAGTIGLAEPPSDAERARADRWIAALGLVDLSSRHIHSLSYGELRRVLLARALAPGPEVLLLDEPLAGLDAGTRALILATLGEVSASGTGLVVVSHHEDEIPRGVRRLARLERGAMVSSGPRAV